MDGHNGARSAQNGRRPDVSRSTLSANAAVFIPRSYQAPPPPEHEQVIPQQYQHQPQQQHHQQQDFGYQNNQPYVQQQQHHQPYDNYHSGGHRGGNSGGGYYNNRGNYRGRGRGRGYRGGRGRGGGYGYGGRGGHGGGMHHGDMQDQQYMVPSQDPVEQIKQVISLLTDNPDMLDSTMPPLTQSLATLIQSETDLRSVVEELFTQSVRETNFRYTGAKMCNYFSENLNVNIPNGSFKSQLLTRCLDEHSKREDYAQSPGAADPLLGFTLFSGELLVNLTEEGKTDESVHVLTGTIQDLVDTLLTAAFDNCLRCVVQVLKVVGSSLDCLDSARSPSGKPEKMDAIFDRINTLIQGERMQLPTSRSLKVYLQSVIDLRATEWGKREADGRPKQINPYLNMAVPTPLPDPGAAGIMFDTGGLPSFPVWSNGTPDSNPSEAAHPPLYWSPSEEDEYLEFMMAGGEQPQGQFPGEEMDEEIADAFEEFMKENDARQKGQ